MFTSTLLLALATAAFAAPPVTGTPTPTSPAATATATVAPPPTDQEFSLVGLVTVGKLVNQYTFIAAQPSGSNDSVVLVAQECSPDCLASNPYFFVGNATAGTAALDVDLTHFSGVKTKGAYGLVVPKVGTAKGKVATVTAVLNDERDAAWNYGGDSGPYAGQIHHRETASGNRLWLCSAVVNGKSQVVLKWGNANADLSAPRGCSAVLLTKR